MFDIVFFVSVMDGHHHSPLHFPLNDCFPSQHDIWKNLDLTYTDTGLQQRFSLDCGSDIKTFWDSFWGTD